MKFKDSLYKKIKIALPIFLIVLFVISLIPILQLAGYDYATGDDLGYGAKTHAAWISGHSVVILWKSIKETIYGLYYSWQGTWFTIALMSLQPEVFAPGAYWITPYLLLGVIASSTTLIIWYLGAKILEIESWVWVSIDVLVLIASIQFFPSTASSIYWYNGGVHYIVPFGLAMVSVWCFLSYRDKRCKSRVIIAGVCMTCLGGASYLMPVFVLVVLFYLLLLDWFKKFKHESDAKPIWIMLIPATLEIIGLVISFLSPGNKNRGGEEFGFSVWAILRTILICFKSAFISVFEYLKLYPFIYLCFIAIAIITVWYYQYSDESTFGFKLPGLFVTATYCLYAAIYAPSIYAGVEVSGGVPNTVFQVFVLLTAINIVYVCGWLMKSIRKQSKAKVFEYALYGLMGVVLMLTLTVGRNSLKEATSYEAWKYMQSGQADDFKAQMEYNRNILLDESITECYLCPINGEQGPLMHMPVVEDENNFTNSVNRQFYGKIKVVVDPNLNIQAR